MNNLSIGSLLLIILSIDVLLFLGGFSVQQINPDSPVSLISYDDTMISDYDTGAGEYTIKQDTTVSDLLPDTEESASEESNLFSDAIRTIKGWFLDITGIGYLLSLLGAPVIFLGSFLTFEGANILIFSVGALWYGLTGFLIVAFILGRRT